MDDLSYNVTFNKSALTRGIAEGLENLLKDKTIEERLKIAESILPSLLDLGNYAMYRGFVEYGIKLVVNRYVVPDES